MTLEHSEDEPREEKSEDGYEPLVPEGVIGGISDIGDGDVASKDDIESVLKF